MPASSVGSLGVRDPAHLQSGLVQNQGSNNLQEKSAVDGSLDTGVIQPVGPSFGAAVDGGIAHPQNHVSSTIIPHVGLFSGSPSTGAYQPLANTPAQARSFSASYSVPSLGAGSPTASTYAPNYHAAPAEDNTFVQPKSTYVPSAVVYSPHEVRIMNQASAQRAPAAYNGISTPAMLPSVAFTQTSAGNAKKAGIAPAKSASSKKGKTAEKTTVPKMPPKPRGAGLTRSLVGPVDPPANFVAPRGAQWQQVQDAMLRYMKDDELKEIVRATKPLAQGGNADAARIWKLAQSFVDRRHQLRNNRSARKARNKKEQEIHYWKERAVSLGADDAEFEYEEPEDLHDGYED